MKGKGVFRWASLAAVLLLALWCLFPMRYSKDYVQAFRSVDKDSSQWLLNLLLADYTQIASQDTDNQICYTVEYMNSPEARSPVSVHRLWEDAASGKLVKAEVPTQADILACLEDIDGFGGLLPEVEVIYVSPERVQIGSHMGIREVFWQREGVPLGFFWDENYDNYRLYWLGGDWYYAYSIAR